MRSKFTDQVLVLFLCGYLTFLPGCGGGDNPAGAKNEPPDIPPQGTMSTDLSLFGIQNGTQVLSKDAFSSSEQNFARAVITATVINLNVLVRIAVPVAAIAAALSEVPTFDESDGKWHWNFQYPEVNPVLTLELTGQLNGNAVNWEMFVTRTLPTPLNDFLWFDGESRIDGTEGHWQFYDENRPQENHETVLITWVYNSENDRTLTFLNNNVGDEGFGDSLTYKVDSEIVTMTLIDVSENDTTEISWNTNTREGYIIQGGEKGCWGSNLQDVDCPTG